ncbi:hypothetical protein HOE425_340090 [Hoeflea sp. EC-HK425]|nr:hypothetical protein HOE425_340090 [Hoeflea sp. EC-HK425]
MVPPVASAYMQVRLDGCGDEGMAGLARRRLAADHFFAGLLGNVVAAAMGVRPVPVEQDLRLPGGFHRLVEPRFGIINGERRIPGCRLHVTSSFGLMETVSAYCERRSR